MTSPLVLFFASYCGKLSIRSDAGEKDERPRRNGEENYAQIGNIFHQTLWFILIPCPRIGIIV